jgi:hypothetical protein
MFTAIAISTCSTLGGSEYLRQVPNASVHRCGTCHLKSGPPDLNTFGDAFFDANCKWTRSLAEKDSDGDGITNGHELGDAQGVWRPGEELARAQATVSLPTDAASKPIALGRWAMLLQPVTTLLGRFHPVFVHLPIGGFLLVALLELVALAPSFAHATRNCPIILAVTLAGTVVAVVCGWVLSAGTHYDASLLHWHKWTGLGVGLAGLAALVLHVRRYRRAYQVTLWGTIVLLCIASHYGGSLTHGPDFLSLKVALAVFDLR